LTAGRLIPAEAQVIPFKHGREGENGDWIRENFKFPYNTSGKYILKVTYSSVFEEQWVSRSDQEVPTKVSD
jgi:hypothetical protein